MALATVLQIVGLVGLGAALVLLGIPGLVFVVALFCLSVGVTLEARSSRPKVDS